MSLLLLYIFCVFFCFWHCLNSFLVFCFVKFSVFRKLCTNALMVCSRQTKINVFFFSFDLFTTMHHIFVFLLVGYAPCIFVYCIVVHFLLLKNCSLRDIMFNDNLYFLMPFNSLLLIYLFAPIYYFLSFLLLLPLL